MFKVQGREVLRSAGLKLVLTDEPLATGSSDLVEMFPRTYHIRMATCVVEGSKTEAAKTSTYIASLTGALNWLLRASHQLLT